MKRNRRSVILDVAAELFHDRGYHATGIDEIGAAAGITGPGVYRHFENKHEVLSEVITQAIERILRGVDAIVTETAEPRLVLERLADNMVREVVAEPAAWAVLIREQRHLDPTSFRALTRAHRVHLDHWVDALRPLRPDLTDAEMRMMVHCVLGLSIPIASGDRNGLAAERVVTLFREMALRALFG